MPWRLNDETGESWWDTYKPGDMYTDDDGSKYVWTGTNWGQFDTGGQGADTTTAAQDQDAFYRSIGLDPATIRDAPAADKAAMEGLYSAAGKDSASAGVIKTIKDAFSKKDAAGNITGYDWAKIAAMAPAALSMFGLDKKDTNTYQGTIPSLSATRQQIEYDDPNRRPGSGGRQYFTDTQYSAKGAEGAAKAVSDAQAQGIMANYTKASAPVDKWAGNPATPALAMPWKSSNTGTTTGSLAPWAGDYVTNMLGQGQALANQPYQAYKGPLTAGASDLQQQAFAGASNLASAGYSPTTFNTGTFDTTAAQKYMNPYLQTALDPQLKEMQRQSDIQRLSDSARLAKAGAFGGSRQAIMESEARRNLLDKQAGVIGQGYQTAYDKAMGQFNADQARQMEAQKATEASRQYGADFGIKSLDELSKQGAVQRGITSEGIAADKAQFEEQRDYPYKMVQYQQGLLQGLPISAQSNTQNMSALTSLLANSGYAGQLYDTINKIFNPTAATKTGG